MITRRSQLDPQQTICETLSHTLSDTPHTIRLWGSRARNTHHTGSDYDIIIETNDRLPIQTIFSLRNACEHLPWQTDITSLDRLSPVMKTQFEQDKKLLAQHTE